MRHAHDNREHVHPHDRQRYQVGRPRSHDGRPPARRALANAPSTPPCCSTGSASPPATGWFGSLRPRTNPNQPAVVSGGARLKAILSARAKYQLALPYGPQAAELRLGFHDPPWITKPPERTRRNGKLRTQGRSPSSSPHETARSA